VENLFPGVFGSPPKEKKNIEPSPNPGVKATQRIGDFFTRFEMNCTAIKNRYFLTSTREMRELLRAIPTPP
jgi:hypothetical protein